MMHQAMWGIAKSTSYCFPGISLERYTSNWTYKGRSRLLNLSIVLRAYGFTYQTQAKLVEHYPGLDSQKPPH
jgi:hypothetical protein